MARSHKYIARVRVDDGYRYFYDKDAYDRYRNAELQRRKDANTYIKFSKKDWHYYWENKRRKEKLEARTHKAESLVDKLRNKSYASISSISENVKKIADNLVSKARNVAYSAIASLGHFGKKVRNRVDKEVRNWQQVKRERKHPSTRYGSEASEYERKKNSERTKGTQYNSYPSLIDVK